MAERSLVANWKAAWRSFFEPKQRGSAGGVAAYEDLLEGVEVIDGWTVCKVCLNVDRTASVARRRWRCADCKVDTTNNSQQPLRSYLTDNPLATIEKNLREWTDVKGVRPAYKMLKSARYKCLLTLSKRELPVET